MKGRLIGPRIQSVLFEAFWLEKSDGTVIASSDIQDALLNQLRGKMQNKSIIRLGDGHFYLPTVEEVSAILSVSSLEHKKWFAERFDCDGFAYVLKGEMSLHSYKTTDAQYGLCMGMIWGNFDWVDGFHAVNWFMADDRVIRFIEPQSDAIHDTSRCKDGISLLLA